MGDSSPREAAGQLPEAVSRSAGTAAAPSPASPRTQRQRGGSDAAAASAAASNAAAPALGGRQATPTRAATSADAAARTQGTPGRSGASKRGPPQALPRTPAEQRVADTQEAHADIAAAQDAAHERDFFAVPALATTAAKKVETIRAAGLSSLPALRARAAAAKTTCQTLSDALESLRTELHAPTPAAAQLAKLIKRRNAHELIQQVKDVHDQLRPRLSELGEYEKRLERAESRITTLKAAIEALEVEVEQYKRETGHQTGPVPGAAAIISLYGEQVGELKETRAPLKMEAAADDVLDALGGLDDLSSPQAVLQSFVEELGPIMQEMGDLMQDLVATTVQTSRRLATAAGPNAAPPPPAAPAAADGSAARGPGPRARTAAPAAPAAALAVSRSWRRASAARRVAGRRSRSGPRPSRAEERAAAAGSEKPGDLLPYALRFEGGSEGGRFRVKSDVGSLKEDAVELLNALRGLLGAAKEDQRRADEEAAAAGEEGEVEEGEQVVEGPAAVEAAAAAEPGTGAAAAAAELAGVGGAGGQAEDFPRLGRAGEGANDASAATPAVEWPKKKPAPVPVLELDESEAAAGGTLGGGIPPAGSSGGP
ncbi:hypothetical protein HYH03_002402 [Edaphochlamys debaryana]|uniref:Uncharacterized protein n=1 Tax=Edaphochlamys debaryana TaxID=47281 RepID=A0A835YAN7_9CHLO|nr:hypothetical protein HYH03_002402 [Edaphochlamys debaryana]|eukprot:KAG2499455.1 hypothetical protein HYH03_002402 [Edaphochlamys debaryana]